MAGDQLVSELKEDELAHYGVLGMKWGVRKEERPTVTKAPKAPPEVAYRQKLKSGGELIVYKNPPIKTIGEYLKLPSAKPREGMDLEHNFTLKNERDEKVGEASFYTEGPKKLHLEWLGVRKAHRGNGYASAVMKGMVNYAKDQGIEKLILEVPGESPDARHIYEKVGFKEVEQDSKIKADSWGGLTIMEMDLAKQVNHAASGTLIDYIVKELDAMSGDKLVSELADDELAHYGVLGMKWGRRKDRGSRVTPSEDSKNVRELRTKKVSELSNKELRDLTQRQQLERQYAQLNPKLTEQGKNYVKAGIAFGATGVAVYNMVNSPAGKAAIKAGRLAYQKIINKL